MNQEERLTTALADRYEVEREIGRGGMATVYLARDLKHDRQVAVKVLHPELAETLGARRFLEEIRTVARLNHPHILPLFDSGQADGFLFFVMPFAKGESLQTRLDREKQLPVEDAVRITRELAGALAYAHEEGIIHRDVKPGNVMLEGDHAVLTDFGVAQALTEATEERLTRTGTTLGTPAYMSPEQAAGDRNLDGRSDQYALACLLYEMIAGKPPFTGPTGESVARQHLAADPPPVTQLRSAVPEELVTVLARALAKSPADRFRTVRAFAEAAVAAFGPSASPTPSRRRSVLLPWVLGVGSLAVLVLLALVLWPGLPSGEEGAEAGASQRVMVIPYENQTGDPSLDPVGRWVAEWITEALARTAEVQVVPNLMVLESLARLRAEEGQGGAGVPVQRLAEATGSSIAVTGTYYLRGEEIELHSEVVDLDTEEPLGVVEAVRAPAENPAEALRTVQDRVMGVLTTRLRPGTAWEVPASVQPPTYEAFQHYTRATEDWARGRYHEAAEWFIRAYEADTTFLRSLILGTAAHWNTGDARMVDSLFQVIEPRRNELAPYDRHRLDYAVAGRRGDLAGQLRAAQSGVDLVSGGTLHLALVGALRSTNRPREALENLEEIWLETRALFPEWPPLWDMHTGLRHLLGDHERELEVAREARRIAPNSLHFLTYEGRALAALGRLEELRRVVGEILVVPETPAITRHRALEELALELRAHGHGGEAFDVAAQALAWLEEQAPEYRESTRNRVLRGRLLYLRERWSEAEDVFSALAEAEPSSPDRFPIAEVLGYRGAIAARLGQGELAEQIARDLARLDPAGSPGEDTLWRARIQALLGNREEAVVLLRRAHGEGVAFGLWVHRDMDLEALRGFPPFEEWRRPKG